MGKIPGLEKPACSERLKERVLFNLSKSPQGELTSESRGWTRCNAWKLQLENFRLRIRPRFLTVRVINHWNNGSKGRIDPPSLEVFRASETRV